MGGIQRLIAFAFILIRAGFSQSDLKFYPQPVQATLDTLNGIPVLRGPSVLLDENKLIWGASVIQGDEGLYHMFFSTWDAGPDSLTFPNSWVMNSEIGYATSKYPDKHFKIKKNILRGRIHDGDSTAWDAQAVHNPHVKKFGNKYYLYYSGSRDPGKQPKGSSGEHLSKRNRVQQLQKIGVIEFKNFSDLLEGNFLRPKEPLLIPRTRVKQDNIINPSPKGTEVKPDNIVVVNPSVVYRPDDNKYLLYFKGNWYDPNWRGIHGVAVGDTPMGPFKAEDHIIFNLKMADGKIANAEDPFVWFFEPYDRFFAVVKDFSGRLTGDEPGLAILESHDGINWIKPKYPTFIKKELQVHGLDSAIKVVRLERPQLLLDKDGTPLVFYGACAIESPFNILNHGTFNIHFLLSITAY